jgi:APA family basic amino acid/polyamine antiporter
MTRDLGDPMLILLLWFIGALFALSGAMVYGEPGASLPHAAVAASIIGFSSYALRVDLIEDERRWLTKGLSLALLWGIPLIHCRGINAGGIMQLLLTSTKVVVIGELIPHPTLPPSYPRPSCLEPIHWAFTV